MNIESILDMLLRDGDVGGQEHYWLSHNDLTIKGKVISYFITPETYNRGELMYRSVGTLKRNDNLTLDFHLYTHPSTDGLFAINTIKLSKEFGLDVLFKGRIKFEKNKYYLELSDVLSKPKDKGEELIDKYIENVVRQ